MANLQKREIIILVIAALCVVLYVGYEFLIARPASKKVKTAPSTISVTPVNISASGESKNDLINNKDEFYNHVIKRTELDWEKNPFWKRDAYREWAKIQGVAGASGASSKIIYSGYVISGKNKMAVINGLEYRIGEELEMEGYILQQITPSKVLLSNKNTGSNVEVLLQE